MTFSAECDDGPWISRLDFGDDLDYRLDPGTSYSYIRVNVSTVRLHKVTLSAAK